MFSSNFEPLVDHLEWKNTKYCYLKGSVSLLIFWPLSFHLASLSIILPFNIRQREKKELSKGPTKIELNSSIKIITQYDKHSNLFWWFLPIPSYPLLLHLRTTEHSFLTQYCKDLDICNYQQHSDKACIFNHESKAKTTSKKLSSLRAFLGTAPSIYSFILINKIYKGIPLEY